MKILVTIPHFYRATNLGLYGSLSPDSTARISSLSACLTSLRQTFGRGQGLTFAAGRCLRPTNCREDVELDIVICTRGSDHLIDHLPPGPFYHHNTQADPALLGYECHAVLRNGLGRYDWYVYLEDDLCLTDSEFFFKLAWFGQLAGDERYVLQPNRYELADRPAIFRLYIDGTPFIEERCVKRDDSAPATIEGTHLGRTVVFQQVPNPHSGTFFLTDRQMRRWTEQPDFLNRARTFVGPLESAATLGLIRHFVVYKPSREDAGFLEVRHHDPRYLNRRLRFGPVPPHRMEIIE